MKLKFLRILRTFIMRATQIKLLKWYIFDQQEQQRDQTVNEKINFTGVVLAEESDLVSLHQCESLDYRPNICYFQIFCLSNALISLHSPL